MRNFLSPETQAKNERDLLKTIEGEETTMQDAREGLDVLKLWRRKNRGTDEGGDIIEEYKRKARERWPNSTIFDKELPWDRLKMTINGGIL